MAIKFYNIKSKEVRVADTEPKISAMWASSDRSPNITQGQDFGWRLAPEVVVELDRIKGDEQTLMRIASIFNRPLEDVGEKEILHYISNRTPLDKAPVASEQDYKEEYEAEIRRLKEEEKSKSLSKEEDNASEEIIEQSADQPTEDGSRSVRRGRPASKESDQADSSV